MAAKHVEREIGQAFAPARHGFWRAVVAHDRERPAALGGVDLGEVAGAELDVLGGFREDCTLLVDDGRHVGRGGEQPRGGVGHELHEAHGADRRGRVGVVAALGAHHRIDELGRDAVRLGLRVDDGRVRRREHAAPHPERVAHGLVVEEVLRHARRHAVRPAGATERAVRGAQGLGFAAVRALRDHGFARREIGLGLVVEAERVQQRDAFGQGHGDGIDRGQIGFGSGG